MGRFFKLVGMVVSGYFTYQVGKEVYKEVKRRTSEEDSYDENNEEPVDFSVECEDFFAEEEVEGAAP